MHGIILPIITIIITTVLRIRCMRQIFEHTDKQTFIITSLTSILSVIIITLGYYFKQNRDITEHIYIYSYSIIIIIASIIYFRKQRFLGRIIQSILRISLALVGGAGSTYSLAALGEESFKWLYIKKYIIGLLGKIILLGIISGIVFGRTENMVYIVHYITQSETKDSLLSLITQRGFIPIIVHIGSICVSLFLGFYIQKKLPSFIAWGIAMLVGIGSHYIFNLTQIYQFGAGSGILILGYLIIISYGLFRSDILYIPQDHSKQSI